MQIKKLAAAMLLLGGAYSMPALADHHGEMGMQEGKQCPRADGKGQCPHAKNLEARLAALEAKSAAKASSSWT